MSTFRYQNSGSFKTFYVHFGELGVLKHYEMSVPWGILYIGIYLPQNISNFKWIFSITSYNMGPNFNLNYLSSMLKDIERFDTTTTIYVFLVQNVKAIVNVHMFGVVTLYDLLVTWPIVYLLIYCLRWYIQAPNV